MPATIKPTLLQLYATPKTMAHDFDISEVQVLLDGVKDDTIDSLAFMRENMGETHVHCINAALNGTNGTTANLNVESIDRVCANYNELTNCTDAADAAYDANDIDLYTVGASVWDRDANTYVNYDAYVKYVANARLQLSYVDDVLSNVSKNCGEMPNIIQTGYTSYYRLGQLLQTQQRFVGQTMVEPSVNGIKPIAPGAPGGFVVATYQNIPILQSKDNVADTSAIDRFYFLNTKYLTINTLKPTTYAEIGIMGVEPLALGIFGQEGSYRTVCELVCTRFRSQGKGICS